MKTFKQLVQEKGYNFYGDESLVDFSKKIKGKIETFTIEKDLSDDELEEKYKSLDLIPADPVSMLDFWDEEEYLATHWKDKSNNWCYAIFSRMIFRFWRDERDVDVNRYDRRWGRHCRFVGVRKSSKLKSSTLSDTQSLELPKILTINGMDYKRM